MPDYSLKDIAELKGYIAQRPLIKISADPEKDVILIAQ